LPLKALPDAIYETPWWRGPVGDRLPAIFNPDEDPPTKRICERSDRLGELIALALGDISLVLYEKRLALREQGLQDVLAGREVAEGQKT
jgi:hypothetical protein